LKIPIHVKVGEIVIHIALCLFLLQRGAHRERDLSGIRWSRLSFILIFSRRKPDASCPNVLRPAFLFILGKNVLGTVNDGQDIDLVWFDVINDPVGSLDHFSDLVHFVLRNFAPGERKISDLL
jgi:hypothetical protein